MSSCEQGSGGAIASPRFDHLVVACRTLDAGRAWCEATLGVTPEQGGRHLSMGTHNLLLSLVSPRYPRAYLELIAIDSEAAAPARPRWYDLDDPSLQAAIAEPKLVHWVACSDDVEATAVELRAAGSDPGPVVPFERMTGRGMLRWRLSVPDDGRRPFSGAMPLWIQWEGAHPSDDLPASDVVLESIAVSGISEGLADRLRPLAERRDSSSPLTAVLTGRRDRVTLTSPPPVRISA